MLAERFEALLVFQPCLLFSFALGNFHGRCPPFDLLLFLTRILLLLALYGSGSLAGESTLFIAGSAFSCLAPFCCAICGARPYPKQHKERNDDANGDLDGNRERPKHGKKGVHKSFPPSPVLPAR